MRISPRERRLLAVLGAIVALIALRAIFQLASGGPDPVVAAAAPGRSAEASRFARGARRGEVPIPDRVVALELERLVIPARDLEVGRDPFRFGPLPPPPPPPPPSREELERRRREEEERQRRLAEERAAALIPRPPEVPFVYLGSFGPPSRRIAVLSEGEGDKLINAVAGEVLRGKFIVDRIGYESVDIKFVGFPDAPAKRLAIGG
jgi:hypothetical protein